MYIIYISLIYFSSLIFSRNYVRMTLAKLQCAVECAGTCTEQRTLASVRLRIRFFLFPDGNFFSRELDTDISFSSNIKVLYMSFISTKQ